MPTLLTGGFVLPCDGTRTIHEDGAVLLADDGTIAAVGPAADVAVRPEAGAPGVEVVDTSGHAVLPGLVNAHLHSGLLRGTAESMSLWDWLQTYVDPAHKALTPDISEAASLVCYAESLLAGTTSVLDMWRFPERSAAVAGQLGIRATLAPYVADEEGYDYFETLATNRAAIEAVHGAHNGRVQVWVGLEHLLYCTEKCFADAVALADEAGTGIHTHSSE
ncbi:MAG: amidohydrolase family protein, partial [Actinomycetota bacterium]|nr:amidohydrolase family protein [Actinomycetota bacterium]